ncbi:MAG: GNAT family N-acetyltransferase [Clostridia bacterium]|nr:GNAT family N-acetyltransferase [Clostridia bacterium]
MPILLRPLEEKDVDGMLEWMHSEESKSIFQKDMSNITRENAVSFVKSSQGDTFDRGFVHFAVVDDSDEYLGTISLKNIDKENSCAEYAVSMRAKARGTGASMAATKGILDKAFLEYNLHRVYLNVLTTNERANKFYKKAGFVFEGTSRDSLCIRGEFKSLNWYTIIKEDYLSEVKG